MIEIWADGSCSPNPGKIGVTHTTIQRDIEDGTNVPKEETKPPETQDKNKEDGTNVPKSPLDQSPTDVGNRYRF